MHTETKLSSAQRVAQVQGMLSHLSKLAVLLCLEEQFQTKEELHSPSPALFPGIQGRS